MQPWCTGELKQQAAQFRQQQTRVATPEQKAEVLALAKELPRLWHAPTTQAKDRKQILRLLIKDITVEKPPQKQLVVHIRWQGSACTDLSVQLPPGIADRVRYPAAVVDKVRDLARHLPDREIAEQLNGEGHTSAKGKPWTAKIIQWVRCRYRIPPAELRQPEELTVQQVAQRFGVSDQVVYYWIGRDIVRSRRINPGMPHWITLNDADELKLREWVRCSRRIQPIL